MRQTHIFPCLVALISLASLVLGATVSIISVIPYQAHQCITQCAFYNYQNVPLALGCADPYENGCYCPTATASVSKASVALERCASSRCAAGDYTRDLNSLRSIYAGYCNDAGYSQDATILGYTAAPTDPPPSTAASESSSSSSTPSPGQKTESSQQPSKTAGGQGASTTTQKIVVTQTKGSGADGTAPQVVVQQTETVFVDGARGGGGSSAETSTAIKIGVGIAVPIVVLVLAGIALLIWRKRRQPPRRSVGTILEEHGGGLEPEGIEKDMGIESIIQVRKPLTGAKLADKEGRIVYGLHEVYGSYRPNARDMHGDYTTGFHELQGNHVHVELPDQPVNLNAAGELPGSNAHPRCF